MARYDFNYYPRDNQKPAAGCKIVNSYKNYDDFDTWGGTLEGTKEAIAKTLSKWGIPKLVIEKISYEDALEGVENYLGSDEEDEE